jgi:hypothetical protein
MREDAGYLLDADEVLLSALDALDDDELEADYATVGEAYDAAVERYAELLCVRWETVR